MRGTRFTGMLVLIALSLGLVLLSGPAAADSLSLLTDLEYELSNIETKEKATGLSWKNDRVTFSQLYSLDIQKEITPNLTMNLGGLFDQEKIDTETSDPSGRDSEVRNTTSRPYLDLQLRTPLWQASTGYRRSEVERASSIAENQRNFTEEYSASLGWEPTDLPEVDLDFTRNLAYNQPRTNDQRVDNYQLRSRYTYGPFRFIYSHSTNEAINQITDFETLTNTDNGTIRFSRSFLQGKIAVNSSLRGRRQAIEFSGPGDRLVPTTSAGVVIGNTDDPSPAISDPEEGFTLADADLLVDSVLQANQFSFGLDFGGPTEVDRLLVTFADLGNWTSDDFLWRIYVRDNDTETWRQVTPVRDSTNLAETRFELAFPRIETRYIKIVTTPLAPPQVPSGEDLPVVALIARRTLPSDTSEFVSNDWTGDTTINWKHTEKTSTGYDLLYREQRSKPLDEKKTQLNTGFRLRHRFDEVFVGNMRLQRAESREKGDDPRIDYTLSAALAARYLATFNQSLTNSFNRQRDEEGRTGISNTIFLRTNMDLYRGWSMYLDNGYSWQNPAEGAETDTTFFRVSSKIVPNRWVDLTLSYGISWIHENGQPSSREQDGRLVVTWVPTAAFSLSADLAFTDDTGDESYSTTEQRYFINWSPLRDGTLLFSLGYGRQNDKGDDEEKAWTLSPTLRWQINPKTLLTLEYDLGRREDRFEIVKFNNISLELRFFY